MPFYPGTHWYYVNNALNEMKAFAQKRNVDWVPTEDGGWTFAFEFPLEITPNVEDDGSLKYTFQNAVQGPHFILVADSIEEGWTLWVDMLTSAISNVKKPLRILK